MTDHALSNTRATVIGAGVMGAGIAHVFGVAGAHVALYDTDPEALPPSLEKMRAMARRLHQSTDWIDQRILTTTSLAEAVAGSEIVIEAGPELLSVKQEIFKALTEAALPDAVLASNTSAIPIHEIVSGLSSQERMLGTHFWQPPQLVPLVEVVKAKYTGELALSRTIEILAACHMQPVRINADVPGFVGNRLQHALKREAIALVAAGVCDAETLDTVVKAGFGRRLGVIGPLEQADLSGLELTYKIHNVVMPALDNTPVPHPYLVERIQRGEVGARAGRGFREWRPGEAEALRQRVDDFLVDTALRRHSVPAHDRSGPETTAEEQP